jgi:hypothetical protein
MICLYFKGTIGTYRLHVPHAAAQRGMLLAALGLRAVRQFFSPTGRTAYRVPHCRRHALESHGTAAGRPTRLTVCCLSAGWWTTAHEHRSMPTTAQPMPTVRHITGPVGGVPRWVLCCMRTAQFAQKEVFDLVFSEQKFCSVRPWTARFRRPQTSE